MAVGAGIGRAILMIVGKKMAMKTFGQRASGGRTEDIRAREDMSR